MALATVIASSVGCSVQSGAPSQIDPTGTVGEMLSVPLSKAASPILFDSKGTKAVTITMVDEQAEIYVNAADSSLMVNGVQVVDKTVTPNVIAFAAGSKANFKTIAVTDATGIVGDLVILNYANGLFGQGTATTVGTTVGLKAALANNFVIKGTSGVDNFAFGATGISLTNGAKTPVKDITTANVSSYTAYLGAGDDIFTAGGNAAVGGVFPAAVAVFGGAGNDTLVEGAASTPSETFSGGSGIDTVDYSARVNPVSVVIDAAGVMTSGDTPTTPGDPTAGATEADIILDADVIKGGSGADFLDGGAAGTSVTLNGGLGNDTFCEGAALNSADTLVGGGGVDIVDYSKRTVALTVVMDGKTKSGGPAVTEGDIIGTDVRDINLGVAGGTYTGNTMNNSFFSNKACTGMSVLHGLTGDDTLVEGANANNGCNETFHGEGGIDTVDYSLRTNALNVTMDNTTASGDTVNSEADIIDIDVENLLGGNKADHLVGNLLDNDIEGNGGGDTICGMAGNDTLVAYVAAGTVGTAHLHGNDCADAVAESGAFNICLNTGTTGTPSTATLAGELAANCEVVGQ